MKIKLGVIFGGETVEHEVSIISAIQAINSLNTDKYDIIPIYIAKDRTWYTGNALLDIELYKDMKNIKKECKEVVLCKKEKKYYLYNLNSILKEKIEVDVIFPIVHGNNVEDGSLQGYLETIDIPYVGCPVLGASIGQDKVVMKFVFEANNIPVVPYCWFYDTEYYQDADKVLSSIKKVGYPVVVKPASLGSSIGISFAKNEKEIKEKIEEAVKYDTKIVVEKAVENLTEVNCSVYGNYEYQKSSVIEEVSSDNDFLTYNDKYIGSGKTKGSGKLKGMVNTSRIIPARIDIDTTKKVEELSKKIYKVLNLGGVCRIDYLINSKTKEVYVNEPNTIPGSLAFYLWEPLGLKYSDLLDELINIAIKNHKNNNKKVRSFDTNILSNYEKSNGIKSKLK